MPALDQRSELVALKQLFARDGLRGEVAYRTLREAIIRGILAEGERLLDRSLAEALQLSRTPVREALQRLMTEGFVGNVPRFGLIVAEITPQDVEDTYIVRIALEGAAAQLAAQRASQADIAVLTRLNAQIAHATRGGDLQALTALNKQFHDAIYQASRNRRLAGLLNTLHDSVQRFRRSTLSLPQRAEQALKEHEQIIEAIRDRDPDRAEAIARQHKENAKRARLEMYATQPRV